MEDERLDELIERAVARRPDGIVFLLPRTDGQYSNHATDTLALIEETGVSVDYVTDPMATGVHAEKSADLILPPLLILFSDAATLAAAIEGVTHVIRWFQDHAKRTVAVEVTVQRRADGSSRRKVKIDGATAEKAAVLLREAGKVKPPR